MGRAIHDGGRAGAHVQGDARSCPAHAQRSRLPASHAESERGGRLPRHAGLREVLRRRLQAARASRGDARSRGNEEMKIGAVTPIPVAMPLSKPIKMAGVEIRTADNVLVRLETDDGIVGWGEAASSP